MNNFDNLDSPLLNSPQISSLRNEALEEILKNIAIARFQGAKTDDCLYASLMTMFNAGFATALKLEKDKGESSTVI